MTFPDGTTATGKVDEDGNYTIEIPSNLNLVGGENITASTRDESEMNQKVQKQQLLMQQHQTHQL